MLCDELAHDRLMRQFITGVDVYQRAILASEKFILGPDFALACDGLLENYRELERIAPWCRLPHPLCWFEVSHADRELWRSRSTFHFPKEQFAPSRVGFLLHAPNNPAIFDAYLFWSLTEFSANGGRHNISDGMVHYDFTREPGEPEVPAEKNDDPRFPMYEGRTHLGSYVDLGMARLSRLRRPDADPEHIAKLIRSDWAGEIRFIIAMLGLMNAKNVYEVGQPVYRNLDKMNKRRTLEGKHPLSKHTLLRIRIQHKRSLIHRGKDADSTEIRGRFVRGHFKVIQPGRAGGGGGVYWWGRHWRGSKKNIAEPRPYKVVT